MKRLAVWALAVGIATLAMAGEPASGLSAEEIVAKNVTARGGLEAWRKIQTMTWIGHIERGNAPAPYPRFTLDMKRPDKTRFEIEAQNQVSVRIFDGAQGWKLRLLQSGKPDLQPYTAEELKFARDAQGLDGPLMDHQAKGVAVALDGVDQVEGRKAYRLNVTLSSGVSHHVWIDVQNFLEIKYDRPSRNALGRPGTVSVFYRDYRTIGGLQIPFTIESGVATIADKMMIDKILLNPPLQDRAFTKPNVPQQRQRHGVSIETTRQPAAHWPAWPASPPLVLDVAAPKLRPTFGSGKGL